MNKRTFILITVATIMLLMLAKPSVVNPDSLPIVQTPKDAMSLSHLPSWYDTSWSYRKQIVIAQESGCDIGYQQPFDIEYGSGSDSGVTIYCSSNCQADFDDIRFTEDDGVTLLYYSRAEYTASGDATFFVKLTDDLDAGDVTIYLYYGNAGASSTSDAENTFGVWDDFNRANSDTVGNGWSTDEQSTADIDISGNQLKIYKLQNQYCHADKDTTVRYTSFEAIFYYQGNANGGWTYGNWMTVATLSETNGFQQMYCQQRQSGYFRTGIVNNDTNTYTEVTGVSQGSWFYYFVTVNTTHQSGGYSSSAKWWSDYTMVGSYRTREYYTGSEYTQEIMVGSGSQGYASAPNDWDAGVDSGTGPTAHYCDGVWLRMLPDSGGYAEISSTGSEESMNPPENQGTPSCSNIDDTDNLYAHMKYYQISVDVYDPDGYPCVDYVEFGIWDDSQTTEYFRVRYDEDTDTFSEEVGLGYIDLDTGSSSATESGTYINVTFYIEIDWDHPDLTDIDGKQYVIDDESLSDTDWYELDWDIETRTDFSTGPTLDDGSGTADRGDYNTVGGISASGTIVYYGSALHPPAAEIDVWVSCTAISGSPWQATNYEGTGGTFSVDVDSDEDVLLADTYIFKSVAEGDGGGGNDLSHAGHTDVYYADVVKIASTSVDDNRVNVGDSVNIDFTLVYDYDETQVTTGSVEIEGNTATHQGSGVWRIARVGMSVQAATYDEITISGDTHGMTATDSNGQSETVIWDRIQILTTTSEYAGAGYRINKGTTDQLYVTAQLEYDGHALGSEDTLYSYDGFETYSPFYWDVNKFRTGVTESTVGAWTFTVDLSGASEVTYGITLVNLDGNEQEIIWDQIVVQYYTTADNRIDINTAAQIDVHLHYDYDESHVVDGTVTVNGESASHQGSGTWRITPTKSSVQAVTYNDVQCSGNQYLIIVEDQNGQSDTVIWDRIQIQHLVADGEYMELNQQVNFTVGLIYDYDNANVEAGSFTLRYGSTYLTMTHDTGMNWTASDVSATAVTRTYDYVNGTGSLYGITVIDMNSKSDVVSWDRIILTVTINRQWTVITYNVTISVSGVYDSAGWIWNGTATFNSTWAATFYPSKTTVGNYSYIVTSITNDDLSLVGFSANDVWVVFDDVTITSSPAYYWTQYSVSAVWLIWGPSTSYKWTFNQTWLSAGTILHAYSNQTSPASVGGIYGSSGSFGGFSIGPYNPSWYFTNVSVNVEITVSGTAYDWAIWARVLTVDILHSISISDTEFGLEDDYVTLGFETNWGNATITVWDSVNGAAPSLVAYNPNEGWFQITKSTTDGLHNLTILINGTHSGSTASGQSYSGSDNDYWKYRYYKYTVGVVVPLEVESYWLDLDIGGQQPMVEGYVKTNWQNTTIYVYDNNTLQITVSEGEGGVNFYWWMSESVGLHVIKLAITGDSGASFTNKTRTYYIPNWAVSGLAVTWNMWTFQNNYTLISLSSNWRNCTYYVFLNGSNVATSYNDPVTLNITRTVNAGEYNLTLYADGGTQTWSVSNIRYKVTEEGVTYDYREISYSSGGVTNEYHEENYYENPIGVYLSAEAIALIILAVFFLSIVAYLIFNRWYVLVRAKFITKNT